MINIKINCKNNSFVFKRNNVAKKNPRSLEDEESTKEGKKT